MTNERVGHDDEGMNRNPDEENTMTETRTLAELVQAREDTITAAQTGLTVEQVRVLNRYQAEEVELKNRRSPHAGPKRLFALLKWDGGDRQHYAVVNSDGSIDWTADGIFPEVAHWNYVHQAGDSAVDAFRFIVVEVETGYTIKRANGGYVSGPHPSREYAVKQADRLAAAEAI